MYGLGLKEFLMKLTLFNHIRLLNNSLKCSDRIIYGDCSKRSTWIDKLELW